VLMGLITGVFGGVLRDIVSILSTHTLCQLVEKPAPKHVELANCTELLAII